MNKREKKLTKREEERELEILRLEKIMYDAKQAEIRACEEAGLYPSLELTEEEDEN